MNFKLKIGLVGLAATAILTTGIMNIAPAQAAWNPKKITIIVPHSLGGGQDRLTRAFVKTWEKHLGAKLEIKPKSGASGRVGFDFWQKQARDGTVLISTNIGTTSIMYASQSPSWSWPDTVHILGVMGVDPGAVFTLKDSKYKTLKDVIADAKTRSILFGVSSWGSTENINLHQLPSQVGAKPFRVIPIGGGSDLVTAVLGKHLPVAFGKVSNINKGKGKVRFLAVALDTNPVKDLTGNAPTLDGALGTNTVPVASYRAIIAPKELVTSHPDRIQKLKSSLEAAKDDPEFIARAKKVGIHPSLIWDMDHKALQSQVNSFWAAYNKDGAFFKQKEKDHSMTVVLTGVKKKGKYILFSDKNGKKWQTRIHREDTKFWINGKSIEGKKNIKKARRVLKAGDTCAITYAAMPVVAETAKCTSKKSL